jgi:hypothetical protein
VHHCFGFEEQLFVATMHLPTVPDDVLAPLFAGGLGERVVRFFLWFYSDPSNREPPLVLMRGFVTEAVVGRVAAGIDAPDRELRASLAVSQRWSRSRRRAASGHVRPGRGRRHRHGARGAARRRRHPAPSYEPGGPGRSAERDRQGAWVRTRT